MDSNQAYRSRLDALLGRLLDPDELQHLEALAQALGVRLQVTWWRTDLRTGRTTRLNAYGAAATRSAPTPPALRTSVTDESTTIPTQ